MEEEAGEGRKGRNTDTRGQRSQVEGRAVARTAEKWGLEGEID